MEIKELKNTQDTILLYELNNRVKITEIKSMNLWNRSVEFIQPE